MLTTDPCWEDEHPSSSFSIPASTTFAFKLFEKDILKCLPFVIALSWASLVAQWCRIHLSVQEMWIRSLGQEDPLEKEMATHSSILAWEIPWTEDPGRLQSMGSQRVRHDLVTKPPPQQNNFISLFSILVISVFLKLRESLRRIKEVQDIPAFMALKAILKRY